MRCDRIRVCRRSSQALGAGSVQEPYSQRPCPGGGGDDEFPEYEVLGVAASTTEGLDSKSLGVGKALGKVVTGEGRF